MQLLSTARNTQGPFPDSTCRRHYRGPWNDFSFGIAPGGLVTTGLRWFFNLIYVPLQWLFGESFPADGGTTCRKAMDWGDQDLEVRDPGYDVRMFRPPMAHE